MTLLPNKLDLIMQGIKTYLLYILIGIIIILSLTTLWFRSEVNTQNLTIEKLKAESVILDIQKQALLVGLTTQSEEIEKLRINIDKAKNQYNGAKNDIEIKYNNLLNKEFKTKIDMCNAIIALDQEEIKKDEDIINE